MANKHYDRIAKAYAARNAIKPGSASKQTLLVAETTGKILANWAERKELEPAKVIEFFSLA